MMEPIIKACMTELNTQMEGDVLKVCHSYGIDVDKERLMQALTDARKFYDEGYRDGKRDAVRHGRWVMTIYTTTSKRGRVISNKRFACSECGYSNGRKQSNYCLNCGAKMDGDAREPR